MAHPRSSVSPLWGERRLEGQSYCRDVNKMTLLVGATLLISLVGCSSADLEKAQPTPTRDAGPIILTDSDAAVRYLSIVCDNNAAGDALYAAFTAGEAVYLDGGTPDLASLKSAASASLDLNRSAIELLEDEYFAWPENVAEHITFVRQGYMAGLSQLDGIINAATFEEAYGTPSPVLTPEQDAAGQEVRYQLGLDADTTASCTDSLGGIAILMEEKSARDAD